MKKLILFFLLISTLCFGAQLRLGENGSLRMGPGNPENNQHYSNYDLVSLQFEDNLVDLVNNPTWSFSGGGTLIFTNSRVFGRKALTFRRNFGATVGVCLTNTVYLQNPARLRISAWLKPKYIPSLSSLAGGKSQIFYIIQCTNQGDLRLGVKTTETGNYICRRLIGVDKPDIPITMVPGKFFKFEFLSYHDTSGSYIAYYIDGVQVASDSDYYDPAIAGPMVLGQEVAQDAAVQSYRMTMDDFEISRAGGGDYIMLPPTAPLTRPYLGRPIHVPYGGMLKLGE